MAMTAQEIEDFIDLFELATGVVIVEPVDADDAAHWTLEILKEVADAAVCNTVVGLPLQLMLQQQCFLTSQGPPYIA